jgi:hypothetical protein
MKDKKIWNFEDNGETHIPDVIGLMKEYVSGFNESQKLIEAHIDASINDRSEAVIRMILDSGYVLISCTIGFDGFVEVSINYYPLMKSVRMEIRKLEEYLDKVIQSKEMGSVISHLMRVKEISIRK